MKIKILRKSGKNLHRVDDRFLQKQDAGIIGDVVIIIVRMRHDSSDIIDISTGSVSAGANSDGNGRGRDSIAAVSSGQDSVTSEPGTTASQRSIVQEDNLEGSFRDVNFGTSNNFVLGFINDWEVFYLFPVNSIFFHKSTKSWKNFDDYQNLWGKGPLRVLA